MTDIFRQNVEWNIKQIAVQFAQTQKVRGRAKSGYYKAAIILAASVVEALSYKLLQKNSHLEMPLEDWCCLESSLLPASYVVNGMRLSICKRTQQRFQLKKHTDFKKVNEVCKKLFIINDSQFKRLEKIRNLRNKIHIQGLEMTDRSYTKKELEFVSSIINTLLEKVYSN